MNELWWKGPQGWEHIDDWTGELGQTKDELMAEYVMAYGGGTFEWR